MAERQSNEEKYNEILSAMSKAKEQWDEEDGIEDEQDRMLSQAIELAIEQGRGWSPGEKEAYLEKILDDDFIPPMFASTPEEMEKTGLSEAFTSLIYDGESPTSLMLSFKKKGNEAFANGRRNQANNMQYYRDAINHYYESFAWAQKIQPLMPGDLAQADTDDPTYTEQELKQLKASICTNIALMHLKLKNWGLCRDECKKALNFDQRNVKAWFRLAKSYQMLQNWEEAGDAIDHGLAVDPDNTDLQKLQLQLDTMIQQARKLRQQRERGRAERAAKVKEVWMHCKTSGISLGRVPLVSGVTDEDEEEESRWHQHYPHTGKLPHPTELGWTWPCLFVYPSHNQSDFVENVGEDEMLAVHLAQMFPELETDGESTAIPWDVNDEFQCSRLAIYFEVHSETETSEPVHPDNVERFRDQASCMKFYEATRALMGDEGAEIADVIRAVERKRLYRQRKAWKKKNGSLWAKDPNPIVRVHPAATLKDVLVHSKMVVPSFSQKAIQLINRFWKSTNASGF